MSFIYRDGSLVPRMKLNHTTSVYERFKKFWPTSVVNDVPVYTNKVNFWFNGAYREDEVTKKFVQALGYKWEEFIHQSVDDEIERMFFKFKGGFEWSGKRAYVDFDYPVTPTLPLEVPTGSRITNTFNRDLSIGDEVSVTVSYGGALGRYINFHELEWEATGTAIIADGLNSSEIREVLHSNPWYYFANSRHIDYSKDSSPFQIYDGNNSEALYSGVMTDRKLPVCSVACDGLSPYGIWGLMGDEVSFEPVLDTDGILQIFDEKQLTTSITADDMWTPYDNNPDTEENRILQGEYLSEAGVVVGGEALRYEYTVKYIYKGVKVSDTVVKEILEWYGSSYLDIRDIPYEPAPPDKWRADATTSMIDTKFKHLMHDMLVNPIFTGQRFEEDALFVYDVEYYTDELGGDLLPTVVGTYLKVDGAAAMKKTEFNIMLGSQIDTDYDVEDKDWWENALAIVVVIAAVVAGALICAGSLGSACMVGGQLVWSAVAYAAGAAAMVASLGGMLLMEVGGLSSTDNVKLVGKFAQIVGYIASFAGFMSVMNNFARVGLDQAMQAVKAGNDYYMDQEKKELDKMQEELNELEDEYNQSILNRSVFSGATVMAAANEKLMTPDMISDMATKMEIDSKLLLVPEAFYTSVNS